MSYWVKLRIWFGFRFLYLDNFYGYLLLRVAQCILWCIRWLLFWYRNRSSLLCLYHSGDFKRRRNSPARKNFLIKLPGQALVILYVLVIMSILLLDHMDIEVPRWGNVVFWWCLVRSILEWSLRLHILLGGLCPLDVWGQRIEITWLPRGLFFGLRPNHDLISCVTRWLLGQVVSRLCFRYELSWVCCVSQRCIVFPQSPKFAVFGGKLVWWRDHQRGRPLFKSVTWGWSADVYCFPVSYSSLIYDLGLVSVV